MPVVLDPSEGVINPAPSSRPRVPHSHAFYVRPSPLFQSPRNSSAHTSKRRSGQSSLRSKRHNRQIFTGLACLVVILLLALVSLGKLSGNDTRKQAYVAVLCDDTLFEPCGVLVHSLRATGTQRDIIILVGDVSDVNQRVLAKLGATVLPIRPVEASLPDEEGSPILQSLPCRFCKLLAWNLTQYRKVVYLDSDMLAVHNVDELFLRPPLAAVPNSFPSDHFSTSVMVISPSRNAFLAMVESARQPSANGDEEIINKYYHDWFKRAPKHHLDFGFSANVALSEVSTWHSWVEPHLKILHYSGTGKPWTTRAAPGGTGWGLGVRKFDNIWWQAYNAMYEYLANQGVKVSPLSAHCRSDYTKFGQQGSAPASAELAPIPELQLSVIISLVDDRLDLLEHAVKHYSSVSIVHTIYIALNAGQEDLNLGSAPWAISKPIEFVVSPHGSPNGHFKPIRSMETECVLVVDHNVELSEDILALALQRWQERPFRLVGFYPRAHYRSDGAKSPDSPDHKQELLVWVANPRAEYSMVLSQAALFHMDYLRAYTCHAPKGMHEYVEENPECADAALNFLTSQLAGLPPLLIIDPLKRNYGRHNPPGVLPGSILEASRDGSRPADANGSACLQAMWDVWGLVPLANTSQAVGLYRKEEGFDALLPPSAERAGQAFAPVFDYKSEVSKHPDENFKFMPRVEVTQQSPELCVVPPLEQPPPHSAQQQILPQSALRPRAILCVSGRDPTTGPANLNSYALVDHLSLPPDAVRLTGTTFIMLLRHGFDDNPLQLRDLAGTLFYFWQHISGFPASHLLLYQRGGLVTAVSNSTLSLLQSLLGGNVAPLKLHAAPAVTCFEKAIVIRRHRGALADRPGLLALMRTAIWDHCVGGRTPASPRITVVDDRRPSGKGRLSNVVDLVAALQSDCRSQCAPFVLRESSPFCLKVRAVRSAHIIIGAHGETLTSLVGFATPGAVIMELASPALGRPKPGSEVAEIGPVGFFFKEFSLGRMLTALSLNLTQLTMSTREKSTAPSGYLVRADSQAVAKLATSKLLAMISESKARPDQAGTKQ